ncbi:MAG: bifunctional oligoribonuclease/PAP phosphatase NrnA [Halobacteria archaeon]|nr:bifunctional oligoribonuclease/PAP phosphatase NrnA [Halobacteria archaeon]
MEGSDTGFDSELDEGVPKSSQVHDPTPTRADDLVEALEGGSLAVVCHDNPDPDCIASALALRSVAVEEVGVSEVDIVYSGEVSHQQNRAFVNLLEVEMVGMGEADFAEYDLIAFVDHSVKGENNQVPENVEVDVVIDHHPSDNGVEGGFVDIREGYGATTTILVEYLIELGVEPGQNLATALLFAIRTETLGFLRGTTPGEYDAAKYLHAFADIDLLKAITKRDVRGSALVTCVGRTTERDAIPQAADYLMNLEGVATVLVFGIIDEEIQMSARSDDSRVDLDSVMRDAFGDVGSAGGHHEMAGAQIPLGIFSEMGEEEDKLVELSSEMIKRRFFGAMNLTDDNGGGNGEE